MVPIKKSKHDQRGIAAVEFGLLVLLLFAIVSGFLNKAAEK